MCPLDKRTDLVRHWLFASELAQNDGDEIGRRIGSDMRKVRMEHPRGVRDDRASEAVPVPGMKPAFQESARLPPDPGTPKAS
jgi:hypothetical protein